MKLAMAAAGRCGGELVPRDLLAPDGMWPAGPFVAGTPAGVLAASWAVTVTGAVQVLMAWSVSELAVQVGLSRAAVAAVMDGRALPDVEFVAAVQAHCPVRVWPSPEVVAALRERSGGS